MSRRFRFGVFELDCDRVELHKAGLRVRIQEQPFRILMQLLADPGTVVTREELRRTLWPDETFVDFEHGLNAAVNKLRETLGDSASNPRFVETVPRRGYRFIAPVEIDRVESPPQQLEPPRGEATESRRPGWIAPTAAVLTVIVLGAILLGRRGQSAAGDVVVNALTTYPGRELTPSFSPEGDRVVFSWAPEDQSDFDIYIKQIGSEQPLRLTAHPAHDVQPAWSPDGLSIAFLRFEGTAVAAIMIVPAVGGAERKIGELHTTLAEAITQRPLRWLPDSVHLIVSDQTGLETTRALYRVSALSDDRQQMTFPPPAAADESPDISPNGRMLAFSRRINNFSSDLCVVPLSDRFAPAGEPKQVTHLNRVSTDPLWSADGASLIFISGAQHGVRFYRVRPGASEQPRPLFPASEKTRGGVAISHARNRLVYVHAQWDVNIWKLDLVSPAARPEAFVQSTSLDHLPAIAPDGSRVLYVTNRSGRQELWAARPDGSHGEVLMASDGEITMAAWSPDGRTIAFEGQVNTYKHVFTVSSAGGKPKAITSGSGNHGSPSWSRDGNWIYFRSDRGGKSQIWKAPAAAGAEPVLVPTDHPAYRPIESLDGESLYYVSGMEGSPIFRRSLKTGAEVFFAGPVINLANFEVTKKGLYFIGPAGRDRRAPIQFVPLSGSSPTTLAFTDKLPAYGFSVNSDDRWLLFTQFDTVGSDLMLTENFR